MLIYGYSPTFQFHATELNNRLIFSGLRWRRRRESNPRMTVLQTIALPLGYSAIRMARGRVSKADGRVCQYLDFIGD